MNLYLLTQNVVNDYDTYDSAVVAAENEEDAKTVSPSTHYEWDAAGETWVFVYSSGARRAEESRSDWCQPEHVTAKLIGEASPGRERGCICSSFNAG